MSLGLKDRFCYSPPIEQMPPASRVAIGVYHVVVGVEELTFLAEVLLDTHLITIVWLAGDNDLTAIQSDGLVVVGEHCHTSNDRGTIIIRDVSQVSLQPI